MEAAWVMLLRSPEITPQASSSQPPKPLGPLLPSLPERHPQLASPGAMPLALSRATAPIPGGKA